MADSNVTDPWEGGEAYERFMGRWSRAITRRFVVWLEVAEGRHWADLGSGTGALSQAILEAAAPASVTGIEPAPAFVAYAGRTVTDPRVRFVAGNAASVPLYDNSMDALVSGFVLNFVPEPEVALLEMMRVVRPAGTVAALVWDYLEGMAFLRHFWSAAAELDPAAAQLDEGRRFPLCRPEPLRELFAAAGLERVRVEPLEIETRFADFEDYWQPFLGGTGPAPGYLASLSAAQREALRSQLHGRLAPAADGAIVLTARAWGVAAALPAGT